MDSDFADLFTKACNGGRFSVFVSKLTCVKLRSTQKCERIKTRNWHEAKLVLTMFSEKGKVGDQGKL